MNKKYWPFAVLPSTEQSEQHKREIRFFEAASEQGCKSYELGNGLAFGAEATSGREGIIFRRGRNRWEVSLGSNQMEQSSAFYIDFNEAAETLLTWLGTS